MALSKRPSEELFQAYKAGDKKAYSAIRGDMEHLVRIIARRYKGPATIKELVPIGMTYFDLALRKYAEHRSKADKAGKKLYKFSTYYTWWAKDAIESYLGISGRRLRSVPARSSTARPVHARRRQALGGHSGREQRSSGNGARTRRAQRRTGRQRKKDR